MGNVFYFNFEIKLMELFQKYSNEFLNLLAILLSMLGEEIFIIFLLGYIYWCYDKVLGKKLAIITIASMIWGTLLKGLFVRRRPYMDHKSIKCLRAAHPEDDIMNPNLQGYSMPSLHSVFSASLFGGIAVIKTKDLKKARKASIESAFNTIKKEKALKAIGIALPFLIGLSRIYLGVHHPTDVLAGWVLGGFFVFLFSHLFEKMKNTSLLCIIILISSIPGIFYCKDVEYFSILGVSFGYFAGLIFEEKFISFKNTKSVVKSILRIAGGMALYLLLNYSLKIPFSEEFNKSTAYIALFYRFLRYFITTYVIIGFYPFIFDKFKASSN